VVLPPVAGVSRPVDLRLLRLWDLGRLLVIELLVALIKLEFAAFKIGVGNARRIRWEVGIELVGGEAICPPMTFICEGGIQGARRCMRPRICWGIRRAVARA
jgi:hypothetical protein